MFITFSIIFFLSFSCSFAERTIETDTNYKIYYPDLPWFLDDVSPFSLGSIIDPRILFEFGLFLAQKTKDNLSDACVIGYTQILSENHETSRSYDDVIAPFYASTAYKVAQTTQWIADGLTAGGVFPVLSAKYGIDDSVIFNLKSRKIFPALLIEDEPFEQFRLKALELSIINSEGEVLFYPEMLKKLDWKWYRKIQDESELRKTLLIATIIRLKKGFNFEDFEVFHRPITSEINDRTVIYVKDPRIIDISKFNTGYLIHSTDDFVLERIRLICSGIFNAKGNKNW